MSNYYEIERPQIINLDKVHQAIASVPEQERELARKAISAYAEGFAAGCHFRHQSNRPAGR